MDAGELIGRLEYALLRADVTLDDLAAAARVAAYERFGAITVSSWMVAEAVRLLKTSGVVVDAVAGFPLGTSATEVKAAEAVKAVSAGARMVDVVLPLGRLKGGDDDGVLAELGAIRRAVDDVAGVDGGSDAAHGPGRRVQLRGIVETGLLVHDEVRRAVDALVSASWDMVKTSTGFGPRGATVEDVLLLRRLTGGRAGVKASGGIRSAADALAMFAAGASVVGTGSAPAIAEELREMERRGELQD